MSMIALSIVMAITVEGLVELGKSIGKAALGNFYRMAAPLPRDALGGT